MKYTQIGSVTFNASFEKRDTNEIVLVFSVKDTGIGIHEDDRKKLFTDFQRLDMKKNKNIEGTGLGLAITYKLVKMMEGRITVDSVYSEDSAKIFVVDDNEMNLFVVAGLLKETQIKIDTATGGLEALKKLAETHYDAIFLDRMMPNLDGIQTLKPAKEMSENKSKNPRLFEQTR